MLGPSAARPRPSLGLGVAARRERLALPPAAGCHHGRGPRVGDALPLDELANTAARRRCSLFLAVWGAGGLLLGLLAALRPRSSG